MNVWNTCSLVSYCIAVILVVQCVAAAVPVNPVNDSNGSASFYLLAALLTSVDPTPTPERLVNLYELSYSPQDGSMQSESLSGWNITQLPELEYLERNMLSSFYTIDPDVGQENIYMLASSESGNAETLTSYSVPLNKTSAIFTNQTMPGNSGTYLCAKYDRSTQTTYAVGFSSSTAAMYIIALSGAQGFAAPSKPIFEMSYSDPPPFHVPCALIPADVSGTSTALLSLIFPGEFNQLSTYAVTPTNATLYASPGITPVIGYLEPTLVKNSDQNPTLFYHLSTFSSLQSTFGTIDIVTGLSDTLIPNMPSYFQSMAFEPRVTPPVLVFFGQNPNGPNCTLTIEIEWMTVGIVQTHAGGDYERIIYTNTGNFTIPFPLQTAIFGTFTVGLNGAGIAHSQTALIADV